MTLREIVQVLGNHPLGLTLWLVVPPVVAWLFGLSHRRGRGLEGPRRYLYSVLVYVVSVPGVFAAVLTGYSLFFRNENLLDVNLLVYVAPVVSMVTTLLLIGRSVSFDEVPGFDRLSGLMVLIGASFALALAIQKTRIFLFFGSSFQTLVVLAAGLFALMKWGGHALFGRRGEPKLKPPSLRV